MAVTTLAAVIDVMRTTVKALTGTTHSGVPFKIWDGLANSDPKLKFRDWCENNPTACFRWFSIRRASGITPPFVTNTDLEEVETEVECTVAYPLDARYGKDGAADLDDAIEQDTTKIRDAIGTNGYQTIETASGTSIDISDDIEYGAACAFSVLRFRVIWQRVMP